MICSWIYTNDHDVNNGLLTLITLLRKDTGSNPMSCIDTQYFTLNLPREKVTHLLAGLFDLNKSFDLNHCKQIKKIMCFHLFLLNISSIFINILLIFNYKLYFFKDFCVCVYYYIILQYCKSINLHWTLYNNQLIIWFLLHRPTSIIELNRNID